MERLPRFFHLLHTLTRSERTAFHKWLQSPYHRSNDEYSRFFRAADSINTEKYQAELLWKKAFPERSFSQRKLNRFLSELTKLLERYLTWREQEEDSNLNTYLLRRAMRKRNLSNLQQSHSKKERKQPVSYDSAALFYDYLRDFDALNAVTGVPPKTYSSSLVATISKLDRAYTVERLALEGAYYNLKTIFQTVFDPGSDAFEELKLAPADDPAVEVPRLLKELHKEHRSDILKKVLDLLPNYVNKVDRSTGSGAVRQLINHLNQRMRLQPDGDFHELIFRLNRLGVDRTLFLNQGRLNYRIFLNIINNALRNDEYIWTQRFIETHISFLPEHETIPCNHLVMAQLHLYHKEYDEAEQYLQYPFQGLDLLLRARSLSLQIYYFQSLNSENAHDALLNEMDRFEWWLQDKKQQNLSEVRRKHYLHLIRIVREVMQIRSGVGKRALEKQALIDKLEQKKWFVPYWLYRVIQKL